MRNLDQHAAAVTRLRIGADGATMVEIEQNLETHADNFMRLAIVHVGHETDAASIMFMIRRIKTLGGRQPRIEVERAGQDRIGHLSPSI